jgi:hypothetical protein
MATVNIIPGSSPTYRFEITSPDNGDAFDLTDYTVKFYLKRSMQDADTASEFSGSIDDGITIPFTRKDGVVDVVIPSQATANLRIGRLYPYYLSVTSAGDPSATFISARGEFLPILPRNE